MLTLALPILRHKRPNTRGQHEKNAQALLAAHGISLQIDGIYGPAMEKAVKEFQAHHHLTPSGIIDAATWRALL